MARRSSRSVLYDDDRFGLPFDGIPARVQVEPRYPDLVGEVIRARRGLASYDALVRKAILAGRKEGCTNKGIARDLGCVPSHVGRVIKAHLLMGEVARRRPDFPIHRICDSKWQILAGASEAQMDELLEAALVESVEGLRQQERNRRPSGAQAYRDRSRRQAAGAVESPHDRVLRIADETGLSRFISEGADRAGLARALIRYEHAVSVAGEGVAMATDAK